jgi:hypothetical protein
LPWPIRAQALTQFRRRNLAQSGANSKSSHSPIGNRARLSVTRRAASRDIRARGHGTISCVPHAIFSCKKHRLRAVDASVFPRIAGFGWFAIDLSAAKAGDAILADASKTLVGIAS